MLALLPTSGDGYVETTASETSTARMVGLSHADADQNYTSVDFGMELAQADSASHSGSLTAQQRGEIASSVGTYGSEGQHNGVTVGVGNLAAGTAQARP
jgi:hypothetical protein